MKRLMICLLVLATAGVASAISWTPIATPPDVGYWDDVLNWGGFLPGPAEKTQFSSTQETECVVTNAMTCGQLVLGDGGTGVAANLRIADGGTLNACFAGGDWTAFSYNRKANCVVEAGGAFINGNRLGIGLVGGGDGFLEVYGDVSIAGAFQVGTGGDGTVMIYDGGTVTANYPEMGAAGSALIDIWGGGVLTYNDERTNQIYGFIADGRILGNRLTNNLDVAVVIDAGVTNTVISATPSIPNLEGLSQAEAADVLAQFGYVVGAITVGFEPGAVTGYVIGQDPAAGAAPIAPGSAIDLVVQETSIPNLVGLGYDDATNILTSIGLTVGTVTETYVFDVTPGEVLAQDPVGGGSASEGDPVNMTIMEFLATNSVIETFISGDWMNTNTWSGGVVPVRETQGFEARGRGDTTVTLTNKVAVKLFRGGINGTETGVPFQLDVLDGGHLVTAQLNSLDYAEIGGNATATLNVYTNGIFESRETIRFGWNNNAVLNIDGGTVIAENWMSFGRNDLSTSTETTIKNGGSLEILRFRNDMTNGVITMYDGTFKMFGTGRVGMLQGGLDNGVIRIADGYSYTLDNSSGDSVITSYLPGYANWAKGWGVDIGAEGENYDGDVDDNLTEYVLNGDPTNALVTSVQPTFVDVGGSFDYTHLIRNDDPNLVYTVETKTDLTAAWADTGYTILGTNLTGSAYDEVVNSIPQTADETFVHLKIENP